MLPIHVGATFAAWIACWLLQSCMAAAPVVKGRPAAGASVPLESLTDINGTTHRLGDAFQPENPQLVALVFWQVWCQACLQKAPQVAEAQRQSSSRVKFIGIVPGTDDYVNETEVRLTAEKYGMSYPQVRDRNLTLSNRFGVSGTPHFVLIGPNQETLYSGSSMPNWDDYVHAP